jgi:photosystem II stability/assembly factor-like uncharacterized protein
LTGEARDYPHMKRAIAALSTALLISLAVSPAAAAPKSVVDALHWRSVGPYIGGRVVAVAGVPGQQNLFYMGGVQGGVWKSVNYGLSWENLTDGKLPGTATSIGALAVALSDPRVIYAGTGESDVRGDFDTGEGIYRSSDAGKTWHYAGLRETHTTTSIVVDPRNPDVVYATSLGHVFAPNPERGVFKTTDGGKTWRTILTVDAKTGGEQIVMDPRNPNVLYASMWQVQRQPWALTSGGPGSGLYKSTDAGAHWTNISKHPGFAAGLLGKMGIAVSPVDPRVVYAIVQAHEGGVFRSNDAGATWKRVNAEMRLRQRAFYYMAIFADPKNVNVLYAPQVDGVFKSKNGGKTWATLSPPHGDCHIVWINPHNPKILLEGDDGGATVSVDGGTTWSSVNNQATGQFYHVALDSQFPFHIYGAQQDEGAVEGPSASAEGLSLGAWHPVAFGESTFVAPDPDDTGVTFGSGYNSSLIRMNTPLYTQKNVSPWPKYVSGAASSASTYRFGWTHPIFFSPVRPHRLYTAAQVVFESDDRGETWRVVSPDLTRNDPRTEGPSGGPIDFDHTGVEMFPDLASLAVSPVAGDVLWAGSADGLVHVTKDNGLTWSAVTPPTLPQWAQISSIEPSRLDAGTAYVTASRYMWDDFHPYAYKTTDYGAHWSQITQGLPNDQYVFVVRQDPREPRLLFAGTRSSVYASYDGGARWQPLKLNLPGVQVRDLAIDARQGDLVAATHGRAFWILDNLAVLEQVARGASTATGATVLAPETAWLTRAYGSYSAPNFGDNPPYGATVFFSLPASYNGTTPATLTFSDAAGKTIRSFALHLRNKKEKKPAPQVLVDQDDATAISRGLKEVTAAVPGANVFQWNLRYPPAMEVRGFRKPTTDDFDDGVQGPTVLPGTYDVTLSYGSTKVTQPLHIALDPRITPAPGALAARLALGMGLRDSLDTLNRTIDGAFAARSRLSTAKRAQLDRELAHDIEMRFHSDEGDVLLPTQLRDRLAFLLNSLDLAYEAPTAAESQTAKELEDDATASVGRIQAILRAGP